ncbi:hypothetical protein JCM30566_16350 [Marinitoga arctica]
MPKYLNLCEKDFFKISEKNKYIIGVADIIKDPLVAVVYCKAEFSNKKYAVTPKKPDNITYINSFFEYFISFRIKNIRIDVDIKNLKKAAVIGGIV